MAINAIVVAVVDCGGGARDKTSKVDGGDASDGSCTRRHSPTLLPLQPALNSRARARLQPRVVMRIERCTRACGGGGSRSPLVMTSQRARADQLFNKQQPSRQRCARDTRARGRHSQRVRACLSFIKAIDASSRGGGGAQRRARLSMVVVAKIRANELQLGRRKTTSLLEANFIELHTRARERVSTMQQQ